MLIIGLWMPLFCLFSPYSHVISLPLFFSNPPTASSLEVFTLCLECSSREPHGICRLQWKCHLLRLFFPLTHSKLARLIFSSRHCTKCQKLPLFPDLYVHYLTYPTQCTELVSLYIPSLQSTACHTEHYLIRE